MTNLPPPAEPQDAVIDFLSRPASYGLRDGAVERIETHCSIVFLAADRAYKLKRAIRYASLDYTTDELRRRACESELLLNRRTAPEIYLGVHAINRGANSELAFDGSGLALDHVVVMRRFAQSDLFDQLAKAGQLTPALMQALGEAVARFHAAAEPMPIFGGSDAIRSVIDDNDSELALVAAALDGAAVGTVSNRARSTLDIVAALLDRRRAEGSVRRCHGDLRLANICLYNGHPTLFDCIEFSEEIGCIDALYDLAFLLMDLHLCGRGDLGNVVFNAYLDHAHETDGLRAMPLFLSLRATTRSYALAGAAHRRKTPHEAARLSTLAKHHIDAAIRFLSPQRPVLVMLGSDDDRQRTETAAMLAALLPPAPGARVLPLGSSAEAVWREAFGVLEAGCSVLLHGMFTKSVEQNAIAALPSPVRVYPFWLGPLPAALNGAIWRSLDANKGVSAAVTQAVRVVAAAGVQSRPYNTIQS
jgi:uncharacterized protein